MSPPALQVGIDFGQKKVDLCVLAPDGQVLDRHRSFANTWPGYQQVRAYLLHQLAAGSWTQLEISAEATGYYWLPFFLQLSRDPQFLPDQVRLYLDNPHQVHWFKKSFAQDHKSDEADPYYIAERNRTRMYKHPWRAQPEWWGLRLYTRLRFHLGQALTREKNYTQGYLFVRYSAYELTHPFSDTFGTTSRTLLTHPPILSQLGHLDLESLTQQLDDLSHHHLRDAQGNAQRLQEALGNSFPVEPAQAEALQHLLELSLEQIGRLETACQQVESWIATEVEQHHPEVNYLDSIPGIGQYTAAGIAAEIGDLSRFFEGPKWDKPHQRERGKTLKDVEDAVARYAGLWWPRKSSGNFEAEERRMSKQGNRYLRYYVIEGAQRMRQSIPAYARYYARKYAEVPRFKHKRALVLTARKSMGLLVGLLHRQQAYRPQEE